MSSFVSVYFSYVISVRFLLSFLSCALSSYIGRLAMMGRDKVSEWLLLRTFYSSPGDLRCGPWMMILTRDNSQLVYQSALAASSTVRRSCQQRLSVPAPQYWLVSCQQRHLWSEWEVGEGNENLVYPSLWTSRVLLHAIKSYDVGPPALLSVRRKVCCGFLSPLKFHHLGRARTRNLWIQLQAH
jgi:hypothetical protein